MMLKLCSEYAKDHALTFNTKTSDAISFVNNRWIAPSNPNIWSNDSVLATKVEMVHVGVVMPMTCCEEAAIAKWVRSGGDYSIDRVWMTIVDKQLSHTWLMAAIDGTIANHQLVRQ